MPDGTAYAIVERPASGEGSEIVRYDAATGARTVLVAATRLVPSGSKTPLDIDDYAWSADGKRLLLFTNTVKVWRQNTRGDYWVLDVATGGGTDAAFAALKSRGAVIEGMGLSGFGAHSNDAEYVQIDTIVPRLYLASRLIMDLSQDKVK